MLVEAPRTDTDTVGMCRGKISSHLFWSSLYFKSVRKNLFVYCCIIFKQTINANCLHIVFIGNSSFLCLLAKARIIILEQLKAFGWKKKKKKKKSKLCCKAAVCTFTHTHGLLQRSANDLLGFSTQAFVTGHGRVF